MFIVNQSKLTLIIDLCYLSYSLSFKISKNKDVYTLMVIIVDTLDLIEFEIRQATSDF